MKAIYKLAALSLTIISLSAGATSSSNTERYRVTSSNPVDKGHYILVTKYTDSDEERVRFDLCRTELKKCSAIGNKPSYSVAELKKLISRAREGLKESANAAAGLTAGSVVVGISTLHPVTAILLPVIVRGVYEWKAYPGDHYKRQVRDAEQLIAKNKSVVVESLDDTLDDLQALLNPKEKYLPSDYSKPAHVPYGSTGTVRLTR